MHQLELRSTAFFLLAVAYLLVHLRVLEGARAATDGGGVPLSLTLVP